MPRQSSWDDDDDDHDWASESDDDESEPTFPCPGCGRQIYEEAHACPYCGEYLAFDDPHGGPSRPWWVWVGVIAALASILGGVLVMLLGLLSWS